MPDHDYALVDALQYTYDGNQVTVVEDAHYSAYYLGAQDFKNNAWQANEYAYDANGNMVKDLNKEIVTLSYNSLNLPDTIQLKDGHMEVLSYDAAGRKEGVTRVTVNTSGVTIPIGKTLENAGVGAVSKSYAYTKYASNVVYNNTRISEILLPGGMLKRTNALTTNPPVFSYYYYVNDHLGNVRAVIDGSGTIKQVNNYYPFGMEYGESSENQSMMTFQNYQFGGKEFDSKYELNLYDFGARFYDATRGQWTTPDPLAEKYYSISPYVYCHNNPVNRIDPNGLTDYNVTEDGHVNKKKSNWDWIKILFGKMDKNDRLIAVGNKNNTLEVTAGSIGKINNLPGDKGQYFCVNNEKDAGKVEDFLHKNTRVEWGRTEATKSKQKVNVLSTSHDARTERVAPMIADNLLINGWNVTQITHSDLEGEGPSGYHTWDKDFEYTDRKVIETLNINHPDNTIVHRVYDVRHRQYIYYNNVYIYKYENKGK
jgi:RHS repeat-associated protein